MSQKEARRLGIIQQIQQRTLKQAKAAEILLLSGRQVRRMVKAFHKDGAKALIHGLRGKTGNHSLKAGLKNKALKLIKEKYRDFGPTLASEKLDELDNLTIHPETLRLTMIDAKLWEPKPRKSKHREWRPRKDCFGEMVQFDGSDHDWFEKRRKRCVLLASRDDATNYTEALFSEAESKNSVFLFWKKYIQKHGRPQSIYLDCHSIYKTTRPVQNEGERLEPTQFERAAKELSIEVIHAYSPQAKGRAENLFKTLQDRLVKELRLRNISDIKTANCLLKEEFLPKFNHRFAKAAKMPANLHQNMARDADLDSILCTKENRYVGNDMTIRFHNKWYQLKDIQPTLVLPKDKVMVEEHTDRVICLCLRGKYLNFTVSAKKPEQKKSLVYALTSSPQPPRLYPKPAPDHPWRKFIIKSKKPDISKLEKIGHF